MVKVNDYEVPEGLYYSKEYIWVRVEGEKARIGVTDYAQQQLREIVFVELPSVGGSIKQQEPFGSVESVKAVSDLIAAISGVIDQANEKVVETPELLNTDPYGEGWLLIVSPTNLDHELKELMNFDKAVEWHTEIAKKG